MTHLHVSVKSNSSLVYVSVAKRAAQTYHSFEVKDVFKHNFNFSVIDCAFFVHCAVYAEKKVAKEFEPM